ncbi:MAG: chaperone modulator CbpM [Gammaproteobacteria bacterium]
MLNDNVFYTISAVCDSYKLNQETINEMVAWGIAEPSGNNPGKWLFTHDDFERIGRASRINNELKINMPGVALALQLIEDIKNLHDKEN